ncbi:MAG: dual specificity protein phosphatase family protein [Nitrososphaerota archaeon]
MTPGDLMRRIRAAFADRPYNFGWFNGQIAASGRPVSRSQLEYVAAQGINAIISLTEDPIPPQLLKGLSLEYHHVPMMDHEMPDAETLERAVKLLADLISSGKKVLVHCAAGQGRTGTVLAAYLIVTEGLQPDEAIARVRSVRPGSVEPEQEIGLREWARSRGSGRERV